MITLRNTIGKLAVAGLATLACLLISPPKAESGRTVCNPGYVMCLDFCWTPCFRQCSAGGTGEYRCNEYCSGLPETNTCYYGCYLSHCYPEV